MIERTIGEGRGHVRYLAASEGLQIYAAADASLYYYMLRTVYDVMEADCPVGMCGGGTEINSTCVYCVCSRP